MRNKGEASICDKFLRSCGRPRQRLVRTEAPTETDPVNVLNFGSPAHPVKEIEVITHIEYLAESANRGKRRRRRSKFRSMKAT
jgi:hypothetical protein